MNKIDYELKHEVKLEKDNLFCPKCGKKKLHYIDYNPDYTHICLNCETEMTLKGFVIPDRKKKYELSTYKGGNI